MSIVLKTPAAYAVDEAETDDQKFISCTTVLDNLAKDALLYWAVDETAKCAVADHKAISDWVERGQIDAAMEWLTKARNRTNKSRLSATELGTRVHAHAEALADGRQPELDNEHPQVLPLVRQLVDWWHAVKPEPIASELTVYHTGLGYAGSLDLIAAIDGVPTICDFKTSAETHYKSGKERGPYPEQVGLQLAAYRYAEFAAQFEARKIETWSRRYYLLGPEDQKNSIPVPTVEAAGVIHITPEWCRLYPIRADAEVFHFFKCVLEIHRWRNDKSKNVLGKPATGDIAAALRAINEPRERQTRKGTVVLPPTNVQIPETRRPF